MLNLAVFSGPLVQSKRRNEKQKKMKHRGTEFTEVCFFKSPLIIPQGMFCEIGVSVKSRQIVLNLAVFRGPLVQSKRRNEKQKKLKHRGTESTERFIMRKSH